ncbi:MAG: hypothetical protein K0Q87_4499 [Neobacillus sp.]|jgi:hypothetical protein|nr:hypothetical protein [Neobacillus sp.]
MFKTQLITLTSSVVQRKGNIESDMDGEKVMMNIKNGKYYNLGSIGGAIWTLIPKPVQINEIISNLILVYDVDHAECEKQVLSFLEQLYMEGLIEIC